MNLEKEFQAMERKEKKIPHNSKGYKYTGHVFKDGIQMKFTDLGYAPSGRTDFNLIMNQYTGKDFKTRDLFDYDAFCADLVKPKGAPFAEVFAAAHDEPRKDVKIDEAKIRGFLTRL